MHFGSKVVHQVESLALITTLPWIVLLTLSVSIELVFSSARITSVKFQKHLGVRENWIHRSEPRYLAPGSDKNPWTMNQIRKDLELFLGAKSVLVCSL